MTECVSKKYFAIQADRDRLVEKNEQLVSELMALYEKREKEFEELENYKRRYKNVRKIAMEALSNRVKEEDSTSIKQNKRSGQHCLCCRASTSRD